MVPMSVSVRLVDPQKPGAAESWERWVTLGETQAAHRVWGSGRRNRTKKPYQKWIETRFSEKVCPPICRSQKSEGRRWKAGRHRHSKQTLEPERKIVAGDPNLVIETRLPGLCLKSTFALLLVVIRRAKGS